MEVEEPRVESGGGHAEGFQKLVRKDGRQYTSSAVFLVRQGSANNPPVNVVGIRDLIAKIGPSDICPAYLGQLLAKGAKLEVNGYYIERKTFVTEDAKPIALHNLM